MSRTYDVVDADGHVLEPGDLWFEQIEPRFRKQAPRVILDTDGRHRILIGGKAHGAPLGLAMSGSVGRSLDEIPGMGYPDGRRGGFDPHARIEDMDLDGIDAAVLYPTLGLFSGAITDPDLAAAVCRTYNRWITEYCRPYPERLFGVAMLPMQSVEHTIAELRHARHSLGLRSGFIRPNPYNERRLNDPAYDPIWAEAQELDFAIAFHEASSSGVDVVGVNRIHGFGARHIVSHTMEMMVAAVNVIWGGLCERYPRLRFGFMEASGGWMAPWLDRMDHHFEQGRLFDDAALLKMRPSDYFRRQCWISFEPGESTLASAAELLGPSKLLWATDYPHFDGYFPGAPRMVAARLPERIRRDVMAQGAIDFYKLNG